MGTITIRFYTVVWEKDGKEVRQAVDGPSKRRVEAWAKRESAHTGKRFIRVDIGASF